MSDELNALGASAEANRELYQYSEPDVRTLETFDCPDCTGQMVIEVTAPEFTSLCPKTGQPDYAEIAVQYIPNELCLESKSWKLYLMQFRDEGAFHEDIVATITAHLVEVLNPQYLKVIGRFAPRGGISFHPTMVYDARSEED